MDDLLAYALARYRLPTTNGVWATAALPHQASNQTIQRINPSSEPYHHSHGLTSERLHWASLHCLRFLVTSLRRRQQRARLPHVPT
jgi:hypothetical protein